MKLNLNCNIPSTLYEAQTELQYNTYLCQAQIEL
jgi:hypothetical protein